MNADDFGNLGDVDRLGRIVVGLVVLALGVVGRATLWGTVGVIPVVTGIAGECSLYRLLGRSTRLGRVSAVTKETP